MKKIISIVLSMIILSMNMQISGFAEEQQVEGLHEKLNALFIKNNFTEEQLANMEQQVVDEFNMTWDGYWKGWQILGKHDSEEEEYAYRLSLEKPNFEYGVLITLLKANQMSKKYATQYAEMGNFHYIFDNSQYWSVMPIAENGNSKRFDLNGNLIVNMNEKFNINYYGISITQKNINFLKNEFEIKKMLLEKGETKVDDIKFFSLQNGIFFVYLKCRGNEYLINVHMSQSLDVEFKNKFEKNKIYSASEIMNFIAVEWGEYYAVEKPTYETEALSLQSEGLLNGNDNGLDLLKPLTRIEAAAMLLRAIGETEIAPEGATQAFNDVPSTHWGFGAAINAQTLGIVNGVGDNNFAPDKTVTATEFSTMVLRAANTGEFNWTQALDMLIEQGIITKENSETMDLFTRGDMAKIIYEARNKGLLH